MYKSIKYLLSQYPLNNPIVTGHPETPAVNLILYFQELSGSVPWWGYHISS